jgi:hypothetical protein
MLGGGGFIFGITKRMVLCVAAGAVATAEAGNPKMVVLAMGGGSIEDALFDTDETSDATFSFFAGIDKHGEYKGHFFFKRVYPGVGVRAVKSTEITFLDVGIDECPWVEMKGVATLHATWVNKPIRGEKFHVIAWDCEGVDDAPDMIWFGEYRTDDILTERPALTLAEPTDLAGGNIMIR